MGDEEATLLTPTVLVPLEQLVLQLHHEVHLLVQIRRSLMASADDFEALAVTAEKARDDLAGAAAAIEQAVADLRQNPADPAAQAKLDDAFARLSAVQGVVEQHASDLSAAAQTPTPPSPPPAP